MERGRAGAEGQNMRPTTLTRRELGILRQMVSPESHLADERAMTAAIKSMTSLPLRWAAWQLLDAYRQKQPLEARAELLARLLDRVGVDDRYMGSGIPCL